MYIARETYVQFLSQCSQMQGTLALKKKKKKEQK